MSIPNLSIYTDAQITELKTAVTAERLRRIQGGSIQTGSKNGKSYSVQLMTESELSNLENAIARRLNTGNKTVRRISFN